MIKRFCDVCGAEVKVPYHIGLSFESPVGSDLSDRVHQSKEHLESWELCYKCGVKFSSILINGEFLRRVMSPPPGE